MGRLALLAVLMLAGCGTNPVGPEVVRVPACLDSYRWQKYYMTDSLGVGRIDSIRVLIARGCG